MADGKLTQKQTKNWRRGVSREQAINEALAALRALGVEVPGEESDE
jgi:hypothetical protein